MADGFLGRWAQRKADARQGKPLTEPEAPPNVAQAVPQPAPTATPPARSPPPATAEPAAPAPVAAQAPALTLQDAQALHPDSDFKPFIARGVDSSVRNAAMKKLFADPHYNVMDRLDTYIDDYSRPDPLPLAMLQKMTSAQFLKLVDEDPAPIADATPRTPLAPNAAPAATTTTITRDNHADTDLRLQQDHAPAGPGPGPRAE